MSDEEWVTTPRMHEASTQTTEPYLADVLLLIKTNVQIAMDLVLAMEARTHGK